MGYNRNMKTTIDITDGLVEEAKGLAAARGITFREVVETGLRRVLEDSAPRKTFKLRKASFGKGGLVPGVTWDEIREKAYEGRGG